MNIFYTENILNDTFILDKEESSHIIKVLRKKKNDQIYFTDGKGHLLTCIILDDNHKSVYLRVIKKEFKLKHDYYLHIAIAPTKRIDRLEWFIEKSTEINIDKITPIICSNSERKNTNHEKLTKNIISSSKQSLSFHFPKIEEDCTFLNFINKTKLFDGIKLIAHCSDSSKKTYIGNHLLPKKNYLILIGPEGDFRSEEISLAIREGFHEISLSKKRLRTETAGLFCVNLVNFINS